jgi:hypothetical protein
LHSLSLSRTLEMSLSYLPYKNSIPSHTTSANLFFYLYSAHLGLKYFSPKKTQKYKKSGSF